MERLISLYVENTIGVLARITNLFSSKSYNLNSLTVGPTGDESISRITIGITSDDVTFEQIKKQLNRCVEVITVTDLTNTAVHCKELTYIHVKHCTDSKKTQLFHIAGVYGVKVCDYGKEQLILECLLPPGQNDKLIRLIQNLFSSCEIVRSGAAAIEAIK